MTSNRFAILHHLAPTGEHWDLLIERSDHLATWRLASAPRRSAAEPIECTRIADHRKRYLDYEGPISGGRGLVTRVDRGSYELLQADDDEWILTFAGRLLVGRYRMTRRAPDAAALWTLAAM